MYTEEEVSNMCPRRFCLFKENVTVLRYNEKLLELEENKCYSRSIDTYNNCNDSDLRTNKQKFCALPVADTGGLLQSLIFVIGKAYVITTNIDTTDGLVYGAVGELHHIQYNQITNDSNRAWLIFPSRNTGDIARKKTKAILTVIILINFRYQSK